MTAPLIPSDIAELLTELAALEAAKAESAATLDAAVQEWRERERRLIIREQALYRALAKVTGETG